MTRALILSGFGINCEEESAAAFRLAGAFPDIVHLSQVLSQDTIDYDIIVFPGGFSFGDDLGAGRVLANRIRFGPFLDVLNNHLDRGGFILGICNGFQVLVNLGLLPSPSSLVVNKSGHFEDRWVRCRVPENVRTPLLEPGLEIDLPVRHREGRLLSDAEDCIAMTYDDNFNGSWQSCAALTNATGQVLGMMPHPEAFLSLYNHPNWGQMKREGASEEGGGLRMFRRMVEVVSGVGV